MTELATEIETFAPRLLQALLAADRGAAEETINDALFQARDGVAVLDELLVPVMHEVGSLWEGGEITIADEHLATAIAHGTLTRVYPTLVTADPRTRGSVLLAGADGEQHMLGLRMIADVLEGAGFDVRNTAGSLPPPALSAAVARHRPVLVGLAHTVGGAEPLRRSIAAVRDADARVPILLGGGAVAAAVGAGDLGDGVEVCATARCSLQAALRLTG